MREKGLGEVLAEWAPKLMERDGVEGVGEGIAGGAPCLRVYVRDEPTAERLPAVIDGYRVEAVVTGRIDPARPG